MPDRSLFVPSPTPNLWRLVAGPATALVMAFLMATQVAAQGRTSPGPPPVATLVQLSSDPYTNPVSQHRTEVEPGSFSFGSTVVTAFQVGRFFGGAASNVGFATSHDGGTTWTNGFLPGTTADATPPNPMYQSAGDSTVAYDARDRVWMISYLASPPGDATTDVVLNRSTDGGLTWGLPVVVARTGNSLDKNWTVCDNSPSSPFFGNCYTEFDDNTQGDLMQMSTSTDGGLTWGAGKPTADSVSGIGGQPLVRPDGTVVVPYNGFFSTAQGFTFTIASFVSRDGGATWGVSETITDIALHTDAGGVRTDVPLPSAAMDQTGRIYLSWSDCRFRAGCSSNDIVFITTDDGTTWSSVHRVPIDPVTSTADHFIPGLGADAATGGNGAHLALAYYFYPDTNCTTATCQLEAGFVSSSDGGQTWTPSTTLGALMNLSWLADTSQGRMVGDYISTSFSQGAALPFIAHANAPTNGVFDEATFTVAKVVPGGQAGTIPAGNDPVQVAAGQAAPGGAAPRAS